MTKLMSAIAALAFASLIATAANAEEFQLDGTELHGSEVAQAAAVQSVDGILRIVNAFEAADTSGEMGPITALANSVYAADADVFRSQEFITMADAGGPAFLKTLGFINDVLGEGTEYLAPQQVCAIYAFQPDGPADAVDLAMATAAIVPQFGPVLNTVLVRTEVIGGVRQITSHDYIAAPAGGEGCTGPTAAAFDAEWSTRVQ
jgi:hypothetical protein